MKIQDTSIIAKSWEPMDLLHNFVIQWDLLKLIAFLTEIDYQINRLLDKRFNSIEQ